MTQDMRDLCPTPWTLRPYQVRAIKEVARAWTERDRTMLVMATGTGKTTVFGEVLRRRYQAGRGRALVLAHRIELLTQAAQRLRLGGLGAHLESGDNLAPLHQCQSMEPADVVVATVQSLRGKRLERWDPAAFGTIIVDEAHHATSASYRAILDRFTGAKILGVTATPDRDDGVALGGVIDHLAFEYNLRDGIRDGFLAPLKILGIDTPTIDMSKVRTTKQEHGRDFSADDLGAQLESDKALHELAVPIAKETGNRPTLVFAPTVKSAHGLARVLAAYVGPTAVDSLDGSADADTRRASLTRYQDGRTRILVNCALFTEGFDAPHTSCVAIARPTKSRALYAQMVGRGTRLSPETGKTECLILDMAPGNARHQLVSPVDLLAGKDIEDMDDDVVRDMRAAMSSDDVMEVLQRGERISAARAAARARDRHESNVVADVKYSRRQRDPFEELDIDGAVGSERGPRANDGMLAAIERSGLKLPVRPSIGEAKRILDALRKRREDGLCTIKQARVLERIGLRKDLTFDQAREAMDIIVAHDWHVTPELAERFGAEEA